MVELIHGDQPIIEGLDPEAVHGETERGVGTDQNPVNALQEAAYSIDLSAVAPWSVAQVPLWFDDPVSPEPVFRQRLIVEAGTDGPLRHRDDRLAQPLVLQLVESDEHQSPAFPRSGRRLDQQVLFAPFLESPLLHRAHAEFVRLLIGTSLGICN